jgi:hypothetical protein
MPFIPVANVAEAEVRMLLDAQHVENTLYFLYTAPPDGPTLLSLGNALISWWTTNRAPLAPASVVLSEVVCTDLSSATGAQATAVPLASTPGTMGSPVLPSNDSFTISFRTAFRGRSFRGRNYMVGLGTTQVAGNNLVLGYADAFVSAYEALPALATAEGCTWVVVSRYSGIDPVTKKPIPRAAGIATPIDTVLYTDLVVDSQRRRLPGRGN